MEETGKPPLFVETGADYVYIGLVSFGDIDWDIDQEIVYWTEQEWIDDPTVVYAITNAIILAFTEGPEALADRLGREVIYEDGTWWCGLKDRTTPSVALWKQEDREKDVTSRGITGPGGTA